MKSNANLESSSPPAGHHLRFHSPHMHLDHIYGNEWFALKAEKFARFFGTPLFLGAQTLAVAAWIFLNVIGLFKFDVYPFILLNLAFSLQAAYAAPLILLAQTRQSDRDKAHADADAKHREALALDSQERQVIVGQQTVSGEIAGVSVDRFPTLQQGKFLKTEIVENPPQTRAARSQILIKQ